MSDPRKNIKILFLGQCLQNGYEGIPPSATFPHLVRPMLQTRFPNLTFQLDLQTLHHPQGLKPLLRYRLSHFKPDIALITALALFTATRWRTSLLYEIAPELSLVARSFARKIGGRIRKTGTLGKALKKADDLHPSVSHPPITLDEYERLIVDGIEFCRRTSACRVVLIGPGGFNEDTKDNYELQSPELWSSVNRMIRQIGGRLNVPVINVQEALGEYGGEVFLPHNHRFSQYGQEVVAREVESVLSAQVTTLISNHREDTDHVLRPLELIEQDADSDDRKNKAGRL